MASIFSEELLHLRPMAVDGLPPNDTDLLALHKTALLSFRQESSCTSLLQCPDYQRKPCEKEERNIYVSVYNKIGPDSKKVAIFTVQALLTLKAL